MSEREKHELSFEGFDARVVVEDNGDVWVSFIESGKCVLTMSWDDLSLVVHFTARHGLRMVYAGLVEPGTDD